MTLFVSKDCGESWNPLVTVDEGPSEYSALIELDST